MSHHGKAKAQSSDIPSDDAIQNSPSGSKPPLARDVTDQTNRPQGPGAGLHRGDRRDTHPSFATGKGGRGSTAGKARDGGRSGPLGASGRKSGPKSGENV